MAALPLGAAEAICTRSPAPADRLLGRRQVVRHRFLVPAFAGSNPAAPASLRSLRELRLGKPALTLESSERRLSRRSFSGGGRSSTSTPCKVSARRSLLRRLYERLPDRVRRHNSGFLNLNRGIHRSTGLGAHRPDRFRGRRKAFAFENTQVGLRTSFRQTALLNFPGSAPSRACADRDRPRARRSRRSARRR